MKSREPKQVPAHRPRSAARVRAAVVADLDAIVGLAASLWPEEPVAEHADHMRDVLAGTPPSTLPLVIFVATTGRRLVGFVEIGLRSHADGCDTRRPVGFVEGWFVSAQHRGRGIGRALIDVAERWAAAAGCTELASDTWLDNLEAQRAHKALGFTIVDRCVNFRRSIPTSRSPVRATYPDRRGRGAGP